MADDIAGQLLGREDRSSWCGDVDPTDRFVCQRIRDHALDLHACRNDAGGIHQWKAGGAAGGRGNMPAAIPATDPADDPIGTVRIAHWGGGHSVWQHTGGTPGNEWMCVWSTRHGNEGCTMRPEDVAGFPIAGAVPGTPGAASVGDGAGRLVDALLSGLETAWRDADDLRSSREAWALEADRLDVQIEELTCERDDALDRVRVLETVASIEHGQEMYPGTPAFKVMMELAELRARPVIPAFLAGLVDSLRKAGWSDEQITQYVEERTRPGAAIPADAVVLPDNWRQQFGWLFGVEDAEMHTKACRLVEMWQGKRIGTGDESSAPVSGSDTTAEDCDRCHTFPHELWCSQAPKGLTIGDLRELIVKAMDLHDVHKSKIVAIAQPDGRYQAVVDAGVRFARGQFVLALTPAEQSRVSSGGDTDTTAEAGRP